MMSGLVHPADQFAFDQIIAAQPVWNRMEVAADVLNLPENTLLHAGPMFASTQDITAPILNSSCVAAVYEGLAKDFDQADAMISIGEIELKPAQDYDVVTPLAAVVSMSMPVHVICDAWRGRQRVYSPINAGSRPAMRLGLRSLSVLSHIQWLNTTFLDILQNGLAEGMELIPLAVAGLAQGDDCHGRTIAATHALVEELKNRTPGGINDEDCLDFMESSPSLFLNLWMAATKCMMKLTEGIENSSMICAAGGNGHTIGIQISGVPNRWFTVPALAPKGKFDVDVPVTRALGAIGDSAVIDSFGLGAMAIDFSSGQKEALMNYLPTNYATRISTLPFGSHPDFQMDKLRLGITARNIVQNELAPMIALGILDNEGIEGRLGGGIYDMPIAPFTEALDILGRCEE